MSFLPADYKSPNSSNGYMKLQDGENRIRILSKPILGWEDWHDKKPVRYAMHAKPARSYDEKKPMKHFWAFIVFNYAEERIQVLHVTQASIRKAIENFAKDSDWGDPYAYDIKITRSGSGMDTDYTVNPVPHKPVDSYIVSQFKENPCFLEALFVGEDPFSPFHETATPLAIANESKIEPMPHSEFISLAEVNQLELLISKCDPDVQVNMKKYIETEFSSLHKVPTDKFASLKNSFQKKAEEYTNSNTVPF